MLFLGLCIRSNEILWLCLIRVGIVYPDFWSTLHLLSLVSILGCIICSELVCVRSERGWVIYEGGLMVMMLLRTDLDLWLKCISNRFRVALIGLWLLSQRHVRSTQHMLTPSFYFRKTCLLWELAYSRLPHQHMLVGIRKQFSLWSSWSSSNGRYRGGQRINLAFVRSILNGNDLTCWHSCQNGGGLLRGSDSTLVITVLTRLTPFRLLLTPTILIQTPLFYNLCIRLVRSIILMLLHCVSSFLSRFNHLRLRLHLLLLYLIHLSIYLTNQSVSLCSLYPLMFVTLVR